MSAKQKVRARKMWGKTPVGADALKLYSISVLETEKPYYVLPADAESYDAMVEQGAKAVFPFVEMEWDSLTVWDAARDIAKAQLAAIGIHRPPTKEKK